MSRFERPPFDPFGEGNREQEPTVKKSWLKGVAEGYALWPKKLTPGVSIFVADAVLHDQPENWNSFLTSTLTPQQTTKLESRLSKYHKEGELPYDSDRGIPSLATVFERVSDRDNPPPDNASSIQLLWMDATDYVGNKIVDTTMGSRIYTGSDGSPQTVNKDQVFSNPEVLNLEKAKTIVGAAKRGLLSTDGLELSELAKLGGLTQIKSGNERHKRLLDKYMQKHEELFPYEEAVKFFENVPEIDGIKPTAATKEEIFSRKGWSFVFTCTTLVDDVINKSIKNEGIDQKYLDWISY